MKVEGQLRDKIVAQLADPDSRRIITATRKHSKTALAICKELDLPTSTIYRKIGDLRDCRLLMPDKVVARDDGKKEVAYICTFSEISMKTKEEGIELEIILTGRGKENEWFRLLFPEADSGSPG